MICEIAKLGVDVPEIGDLKERCLPYASDIPADITIREEGIKHNSWPSLSVEDNIYLNSGFSFYRKLLAFDGMMLHASCVVKDGYAYLFSGPCGMGKSTHTGLYQQL